MSERDVDYELVKKVQRGDKKAFNLLVTKYQYKVIKLVGRYVRDQDEMLDVSQEVFIKVFRALDKFRGDSAFYTWVYRIAINTAKNYVISQDRKPLDTDIDTTDGQIFEGRSGLKEYATPEHNLLCEEIEHTIFRVIGNLPRDLREAIMMREVEGLSYEEIAHVMGCPVGTVRSRIFRAREAIDKELKPLLRE